MKRPLKQSEIIYKRFQEKIPAEEANMLHWILGVDDHRVDFNRGRIQAGFQEWSKLFEAPRLEVDET